MPDPRLQAARRTGETYEIKLDGYRGRAEFWSNVPIFPATERPEIATALKDLPDDKVIGGELIALGPDGRPDEAGAVFEF
jgi:ATP-dependent DNA ligase